MEILKGLGITAAVSAVIPLLINRYLSKKDKKADDIQRLKEFQEHQEELNKEFLSTLESLNKSVNILSDSQQALLRDRLIQMFNHYIEKKEMPIYARESLDKMYVQYHKLGGNGAVEPLIERLYDLPTNSSRDGDNI